MKKATMVFLLLIFSTSSFAATCPDHSASLRRFFGQLVAEGEYLGERLQITSTTGSRPTSQSRRGSYVFTNSGNVYTVTTISCGLKPEDQCEQDEQIWRYSPINRCLYVEGIKVRITKSGSNDLRFEYVRSTKTIHANYKINETKNLVINNTTEQPGSFEYLWFSGR